MSYTITTNASQIRVTLNGELAVSEARNVREDLLAAVSNPLPIVIDATNAERIDVSIVQIFHAAAKLTGMLTFENSPPGVRDYLTRAGVCVDTWAGQAAGSESTLKGA